MKTFNIKLISIVAILSFICMLSCEDAEYDAVTSPHIYMLTQDGAKESRITIDEEDITTKLEVRLNQLLEEDVNINIQIDTLYLEQYNKVYKTSYVNLPKEYYSFDSMNITIPTQEIRSSVNVLVKSLSKDMSKLGLTYAIPVTITSVDNNKANILTNEASFLLVVSPTPYADVPVMSRRNGMKMFLKDNIITLNDFTVEYYVKISNLGLNRNNQILFNGRTADGKSEIFMRFAADGAAGKWDKFQVKNQGLNFDAVTSFKNNTWYHIAFVNDSKANKSYIYVNGSLDSSFDNPGLPTTIQSDAGNGVRFCGEEDNDSYMKSNVQGSEIRLWTVARSATEIKNNMSGVDPETPGLEAYWKSNEGEGSVIKDQTGHGHDGILFGTPKWNLNQKVQPGLAD